MLPHLAWGPVSSCWSPSPAWGFWMHLGSHRLCFCFYHLWIRLNPRKEVFFCSKQPLDDSFWQSVHCNLSPCILQESTGPCLRRACTQGMGGVGPCVYHSVSIKASKGVVSLRKQHAQWLGTLIQMLCYFVTLFCYFILNWCFTLLLCFIVLFLTNVLLCFVVFFLTYFLLCCLEPVGKGWCLFNIK